MAISRIICTFARDFTIPEEYQQLIAYAHKCAKGHNHTRWYKSEENDPLQAMMLAGIIVLFREFEDDAAAIAVVDIEDDRHRDLLRDAWQEASQDLRPRQGSQLC